MIPMPTMDTVTLESLIRNCICNEQPMVTLYNTNDVAAKARVLYPKVLLVNKKGEKYIRAFDSLRNETLTFSLRRILAAHHLTV